MRDLRHVAEVAVDQSQPVGTVELFPKCRGTVGRGGIGVDRQDDTVWLASGDKRGGMPTSAEGAVEVTAAALWGEHGNNFVEHHRLVTDRAQIPSRRHDRSSRAVAGIRTGRAGAMELY